MERHRSRCQRLPAFDVAVRSRIRPREIAGDIYRCSKTRFWRKPSIYLAGDYLCMAADPYLGGSAIPRRNDDNAIVATGRSRPRSCVPLQSIDVCLFFTKEAGHSESIDTLCIRRWSDDPGSTLRSRWFGSCLRNPESDHLCGMDNTCRV